MLWGLKICPSVIWDRQQCWPHATSQVACGSQSSLCAGKMLHWTFHIGFKHLFSRNWSLPDKCIQSWCCCWQWLFIWLWPNVNISISFLFHNVGARPPSNCGDTGDVAIMELQRISVKVVNGNRQISGLIVFELSSKKKKSEKERWYGGMDAKTK